jgi:hypothetical protein
MIEEDAGRRCFRVEEFECAWRRSFHKEAFSCAQQDRIHDQQDFVRKPMFEQRRCQCGATPEDKVRAVL